MLNSSYCFTCQFAMTSKKYKFSLVGFWIGIGSTLCNSSHHQWAIGWLSGCFFGELSKWVGDLLMIKDQKSMDLLLLLLALHSSAAAFQAVGYELQGKIIHSAEFSHLLRCANVLSLQMELFLLFEKWKATTASRGEEQIKARAKSKSLHWCLKSSGHGYTFSTEK